MVGEKSASILCPLGMLIHIVNALFNMTESIVFFVHRGIYLHPSKQTVASPSLVFRSILKSPVRGFFYYELFDTPPFLLSNRVVNIFIRAFILAHLGKGFNVH